MHTVTFYSFKGGSGRSMALMNVGALLAKRGKRVLIVDFDLEAPGLTTFDLARPAQPSKGMVDFVLEYLTTNEAPSVQNFVFQAGGQKDLGGELWVMPAGKPDAGYGEKLNSIDWQELYEDRDGFLLFEDLKRQWAEVLKPDYVLIDSRTGHTDIAGICTRQLPDAVCVFFFPNEQNLSGLQKVVADVKEESSQEGRTSITLHFVMSNVPDLDDENQILETRMLTFKNSLGYSDAPSVIHHYNSLALLDQVVFSVERPKSRLSREYEALTKRILQGNPEDREGSIDFLQAIIESFPTPPDGLTTNEMSDRVDKVLKKQGGDGEICFLVARLKRLTGDADQSLELLDRAVKNGFRNPAAYYDRATILAAVGRDDRATEIMLELLATESANFEFIDTLRTARLALRLGLPDLYRLASARPVTSLPVHEQVLLAQELSDSEKGVRLAAKISERLLTEIREDDAFPEIRNEFALRLVAMGELNKALAYLPARENPEKVEDVADAFNVGMIVYWSNSSNAAKPWFERTVALDKAVQETRNDANHLQCLSFAHWALGNASEASELLKRARRAAVGLTGRTFSAWRYYNVSRSTFLEDLDAMRLLYEGGQLIPVFAQEHDLLR